MQNKPNFPMNADELRSRAEDRLRKREDKQKAEDEEQRTEPDMQRLLHELQVRQIELEMQNDELHNTRSEMEVLMEKYIDLYDFAPAGYFSMNAQGCILEANLTGAAMLGADRSQLINQRLTQFVMKEDRSRFLSFLEQIFAQPGKQACEVTLQKVDGSVFWADLHGTANFSLNDCRVAVSDITAHKKEEEAQLHIEKITFKNQELVDEIIQRKAAEESLRQSEGETLLLLNQSRHMQEQLRMLSRRILTVQEEERKRISRELHDEITQTLVGITVQLETLSKGADVDSTTLKKKIARTQKLVEKSVEIAHRFAQELRPTVLDDLGLIPALHDHMKKFMEQTGIRVTLKAFSGVEKLSNEKRTVLYRVAQEALFNIARHAHAYRADVSITKVSTKIHMQIKDNGQSFEAGRLSRTREHGRLGLLGMQERVEMVGGTFSIESSPGIGTTIHALIPTTSLKKEQSRP